MYSNDIVTRITDKQGLIVELEGIIESGAHSEQAALLLEGALQSAREELGKLEIELDAAEKGLYPQGVFQKTGRVTWMRVSEPGFGYGSRRPGAFDHIEAEIVFKLDSEPERAFGFPLQDGVTSGVHQAMVDLIKDAFVNGRSVMVEYEQEVGRANSMVRNLAVTWTPSEASLQAPAA